MEHNTNAQNTKLAKTLKEIGPLDQGTLVSLRTQKKGVQRGRAGSKLVYGNDVVHVLIWTGFSYEALISRSQRKLQALQDEGGLIKRLTKAVHDHGYGGANFQDSALAIQEMQSWFHRVLAERASADKEEAIPGVWEPLYVDGVRVRGSKVYQGKERPLDPRAPVPGHIYIDGVKLGEQIIEHSPNGEWDTKSSMKTVTKNLLRSWLPIGLYVRYELHPEQLSTIRVGKEASIDVERVGIYVQPEVIRSLFKIA